MNEYWMKYLINSSDPKNCEDRKNVETKSCLAQIYVGAKIKSERSWQLKTAKTN